MNTYWKRSACPYDCPDGCGLLLETDGVSIKRVKGDPEHPVTKGFLCRKMNHYERTIHHKDRILTPLKRTGSKGSGLFTPISWEEAIREITDTWKSIIIKDGAQAILPYSYAGTEHTERPFVRRCLRIDLSLCVTKHDRPLTLRYETVYRDEYAYFR